MGFLKTVKGDEVDGVADRLNDQILDGRTNRLRFIQVQVAELG